MPINFDKTEALFIYGYFSKKVRKLEELKNTPGNPIDIETIETDIKLYSSIVKKVEDIYPSFKVLNL